MKSVLFGSLQVFCDESTGRVESAFDAITGSRVVVPPDSYVIGNDLGEMQITRHQFSVDANKNNWTFAEASV